MAIVTTTDPKTGLFRHTGLSTDTKPPGASGDLFYETDTNDKFECSGGSNWVSVVGGGFN